MEGGTQALEMGEADANWELIRDKVIEERFGPTVVPVPFLEDAASYDLLAVLIKKPQLARSLLHRQRCLVPVGPLENLLLLGGAGPAGRELAHCTREYNARVRGESRYEETRLVGGALRHIRLALAGVHKKVAFLVLRPGAVVLRPDLPWLRSQSSLYVIYEVFYCSSLALSVTQGAQHRSFHLERSLPVAFSCLKFALSSKGVLGSQKPTGHTLPARAAWVRMAVLEAPTPAPLPEAPSPAGPAEPRDSTAGRKPWRRLGRPLRPLAGKWPFKRQRPKLGPSTGSLADDPERYSMSLPLLQGVAAAESDTEE
ncbi:uncharacterized protein C11orf42 homolog [Hemicordylus capensis]|uniref:uncharacterized protein C11orf42 homolog n=1 Tax=Hemicordylus capensis TaxID=884348 RepID=UPI002303CC67|nr:uncharacterized protein C11orf42 homolog [Hemicordylus capensis]